MVAPRVTQAPTRTLVTPSDQKARTTQAARRVLVTPSDQKARVTQAAIRILITGASGNSKPSGPVDLGKPYGMPSMISARPIPRRRPPPPPRQPPSTPPSRRPEPPCDPDLEPCRPG